MCNAALSHSQAGNSGLAFNRRVISMIPQVHSRAVSYPNIAETAGVYTLSGLMMSFWIGFASSIAASYAWDLVRPTGFGCGPAIYRTAVGGSSERGAEVREGYLYNDPTLSLIHI